MRRLLVCSLAAPACLAVLAMTSPAFALRIAAPQPGNRVAAADVLLVGRVVGIEDKDVPVTPFPGAAAKTPYRIAIVQVSEVITGPKDLKKIRVGFPAPPMQVNPGGPIRPGIRPGIRIDLKTGQEGLFYLTKFADEPTYRTPNFYDFTPRENGNFAKELETAKTSAKLLADPLANLKSASAETRFQTAALLIARYRAYRPGYDKTAPISAEESKLILKALAEADWSPAKVGVPADRVHPQTVFFQLNLTPKDGWQPPMKVTSPQDYPNAMRAWLQTHADTYRIERRVPGMAVTPPGRLPIQR